MLGIYDGELRTQVLAKLRHPFQDARRVLQPYFDRYIGENAGLSLLILLQFLNSIMAFSCKLLVTDTNIGVPIHPVQILFVRMVITYTCCVLYMYITGSVADAPWGPREKRPLLFLRGGIGFFGVFGLYFSLQYLSLSDAIAITFLIPIVTPTLAFVVLNEIYSWLECLCSIASLAGVTLIAKPDFLFGHMLTTNEEVETSNGEKRLLALMVGICGVFGASAVYIILRKIGPNIHPLILVLYFSLMCVFITTFALILVPGLSLIFPQNRYQWGLFALIGLLGFFMQFCLTAGIQRVKAGRASMISYANMLFAVVWDILIWHHVPGLLSLLGTLLIMGNAYLVLNFSPKDNNTDSNPELLVNKDLESNSSSVEEIPMQTLDKDVKDLS